MKTRSIHSPTYQDFAAALKSLTQVEEPSVLPRILAVSGPSGFLCQKAISVITSSWAAFGVGEAQKIEATDLDYASFQSLWSQQSLFEPVTLYVLRRAANVKSIGSWLTGIGSIDRVKSHMVLDFGEKVSADIKRQLTRLRASHIHCVEPTSSGEFMKIVASFAKRAGLSLADDAIRFLLSAVGSDLARLENEITKMGLVFAGESRTIGQADVAGVVGCLREDDVFELFNVLRQGRAAGASLMTDLFLSRGESAIALNGILARYAREQLERGSLQRGMTGIKACATADRRLKSSGLDESMVLASVVDELLVGRV